MPVGMLPNLGLLLGILAIMFLAMRGVSILVAAPLAALLVIVTNGMDFSALLGRENSYLSGLAGFVVNYYAVFLLGAILAKYMEISGAAQAIAERILDWTGTDRPMTVLVALLLVAAILTYGGISIFVAMFILAPLARPLFRKLDIAWNLFSIPVFVGMSTFTLTMLPGTPTIQNVIPTTYLGTTLTAAPLLGTLGSLVALAYGLWYMRLALLRSIARGETYADFVTGDSGTNQPGPLPPFLTSVLPIVALVVIIWVGSLLEVPHIILIGLGSAVLLSAALFRRWIPDHKAVINLGAAAAVMPLFVTAAAVGFGVVITHAPGFESIAGAILGLPVSPLISLSITSAAFGAITGSTAGGLGIVMEAFAENFLQMGVHPELIHRVAAMAASVCTVLPHSGALLTLYSVSGLNHRNGFVHPFLAMTGANLLALLAVLAAALILYP